MADYQTKISGDRLYHTMSTGYGAPVELFGFTKDGETPMSLLNIALASCVTMCVQGYFARFHQETVLTTLVAASYQEGHFDIRVGVAHALDDEMVAAILAYIDEHCRVKKALREDLTYAITIEENHDS